MSTEACEGMTFTASPPPCRIVGENVMPSSGSISVGRLGIGGVQLGHGGSRERRVLEPRRAGRDRRRAGRCSAAVNGATDDLGLVAGEGGDHPAEAFDGVQVVERHRAVAAAAADRDAKVGEGLLADRERVEAHAVDDRVGAAALVQQVVAAHELGALRGEPAGAAVVAALLVGGGDEQELAGERRAVAREASDGDGLGRHLVLHVGRAAAPDVAVAHGPGEGRDAPFVGLGRHDVEVPEQPQAGSGPRARQADDQVLTFGEVADELGASRPWPAK